MKFYPYFIHLFFDFGKIRYTKVQKKKELNMASLAIIGAGKALIFLRASIKLHVCVCVCVP